MTIFLHFFIFSQAGYDAISPLKYRAQRVSLPVAVTSPGDLIGLAINNMLLIIRHILDSAMCCFFPVTPRSRTTRYVHVSVKCICIFKILLDGFVWESAVSALLSPCVGPETGVLASLSL